MDETCKITIMWVDNQCCILSYFAAGLGIPNSDTQTLKRLKIDSSKNKQMTVHAIVQQCFELFKSKISKTFRGFAPWITPGRAYSTPYNQLHNGFSPHYAYQKTGTSHPLPPPQKKKKKLQDTALIFFQGYKLNLHQV